MGRLTAIGATIVCFLLIILSVSFMEHYGIEGNVNINPNVDVEEWNASKYYLKGLQVKKTVGSDVVYYEAVKENVNKNPVDYSGWWWWESYWKEYTRNGQLIDTDTDTSIFGAIGKGASLYGNFMAFKVDDVPDGFSIYFWALTLALVVALIFAIRGSH